MAGRVQMAILNLGGGRSQTRSGPDHQLRGHLIFEKDQAWSQIGPTGAAGDAICLSWRAPVAVTQMERDVLGRRVRAAPAACRADGPVPCEQAHRSRVGRGGVGQP